MTRHEKSYELTYALSFPLLAASGRASCEEKNHFLSECIRGGPVFIFGVEHSWELALGEAGGTFERTPIVSKSEHV